MSLQILLKHFLSQIFHLTTVKVCLFILLLLKIQKYQKQHKIIPRKLKAKNNRTCIGKIFNIDWDLKKWTKQGSEL